MKDQKKLNKKHNNIQRKLDSRTRKAQYKGKESKEKTLFSDLLGGTSPIHFFNESIVAVRLT